MNAGVALRHMLLVIQHTQPGCAHRSIAWLITWWAGQWAAGVVGSPKTPVRDPAPSPHGCCQSHQQEGSVLCVYRDVAGVAYSTFCVCTRAEHACECAWPWASVTLTSIRPPALSAPRFRKSFEHQQAAVNRESDTIQEFQDVSDVFWTARLKA